MSIIAVKYSHQDLLSTPDDRNRYEIFEGELVVTPAPSLEHQTIVMNLSRLLSTHIVTNDLGKAWGAPVDVYFDEETVVQPDLLFVSKKRLSIIEKQRVNGAPDLIVEVLSPKTEDRDRGFKFRRYAQEGVQEYWLADPDKRVVEVYTLTRTGFELFGTFAGDEEVRSKILEGLRFPVSEVWK